MPVQEFLYFEPVMIFEFDCTETGAKNAQMVIILEGFAGGSSGAILPLILLNGSMKLICGVSSIGARCRLLD